MNNYFLVRDKHGKASLLRYLPILVAFIFSTLLSSCSLVGKSKRGTVKVVKPINRYGYYNPHKHKKAKRTKIVKMYN
jgi:hypothetical protein